MITFVYNTPEGTHEEIDYGLGPSQTPPQKGDEIWLSAPGWLYRVELIRHHYGERGLTKTEVFLAPTLPPAHIPAPHRA